MQNTQRKVNCPMMLHVLVQNAQNKENKMAQMPQILENGRNIITKEKMILTSSEMRGLKMNKKLTYLAS